MEEARAPLDDESCSALLGLSSFLLFSLLFFLLTSNDSRSKEKTRRRCETRRVVGQLNGRVLSKSTKSPDTCARESKRSRTFLGPRLAPRLNSKADKICLLLLLLPREQKYRGKETPGKRSRPRFFQFVFSFHPRVYQIFRVEFERGPSEQRLRIVITLPRKETSLELG